MLDTRIMVQFTATIYVVEVHEHGGICAKFQVWNLLVFDITQWETNVTTWG